MSRAKLLQQLKKLTAQEFAEIIYLYKMPPEQLRSGISQTEQAIDLLNHAEKHNDLARLQTLLAQAAPNALNEPPPLDDRAKHLFIGREAELAQLKQALSRGQKVAITALEGMAGVGKSYLADHYALTHCEQYPRYEVISLNPQQPADAPELLGLLAERLQSAAQGEAVRQALLQQRVLLHIENVDSDAALVACQRLLAHFADCAVLLSGRLHSLNRGSAWQSLPLKPFESAQGIEQIQRELDYLNAEALSDAEAQELVKALHGLPLAIHLAAGYLADNRSVAEFLEDLRETQLTLAPSLVEGCNRQRHHDTLDSAFQLSFAQLDATQQAALSSLGYAPPSGFGLSMASQLCALSEGETRRILQRAQHLGLADDLRNSRQDPARWRIHPLLAEFLRAQSVTDASPRLDDWFLQRLPRPKGEDFSAWHALNAESTALIWWLSSVQGNADRLCKIEQAGAWYAVYNGPYISWQLYCQRLLSHELSDEQRSHALWTLSQTARKAGDLELALSSAQSKQALDKEHGADRDAALAAGVIADILQARGELDEALRIRENEELPVYERLGDVRERAVTLRKIADIFIARGNLEEALKLLREEALPAVEQLGATRDVAVFQGIIANILQARGELDEALRIRENEELPVYERLGDVYSRAVTLGKIADILQARGELDEALRIRENEELPVYERLGDVRSLLITRAQLGMGLMQKSPAQRERAEELLTLALADARRLRLPEAGQIEEIMQHFGFALPPA